MPSESDYGHLDLTSLLPQWAGIRSLAAEVERVDQSRDLGLTARKFDESAPAGHRGYINAYAQIGNGIEHIDALQALLLQRATPRAPWTLLRSVFEAGFWSTWLLEPDDAELRRCRGLRAEVLGAKQRIAFYEEFFRYDPSELAAVKQRDVELMSTYRDEATALGVAWSAINNKIGVVDELQRLDVVRTMKPQMQAATRAVWRSLSGMQHGHAYAMLLNADVQPGGRDTVGGRHVTITIKDDAFTASVTAANLLLLEGIRLYLRRSTRTD